MNEEAKARGIKLQVISTARPADQEVENVAPGVKAVPANKSGKVPNNGSKHWIGRAIDVNPMDRDGKRYKKADMAKNENGVREINKWRWPWGDARLPENQVDRIGRLSRNRGICF